MSDLSMRNWEASDTKIAASPGRNDLNRLASPHGFSKRSPPNRVRYVFYGVRNLVSLQ